MSVICQVKCPYCGITKEIALEPSDAFLAPMMTYETSKKVYRICLCNVEQRSLDPPRMGCGRQFIIAINLDIHIETLKIDGEE